MTSCVPGALAVEFYPRMTGWRLIFERGCGRIFVEESMAFITDYFERKYSL